MRRVRLDGAGGPERADARLRLALVGCGRNGPTLRAALEREGVSVRVVDQEDRKSLDGDHPFDLVVLGDGEFGAKLLDRVAELRQTGARLLVLAPRADAELARSVLSAGADDVLPPPHSGQAILFRATVMGTRGRADDGVGRVRFGERLLDREGRRLVEGDRPINLSAREFELLNRLLEEDGGVVKRETLLRDIWGENQDSEGVLEATVHRLRRKLEDDVSEPRHLTTVRGVGYRLEPARHRADRG